MPKKQPYVREPLISKAGFIGEFSQFVDKIKQMPSLSSCRQPPADKANVSAGTSSTKLDSCVTPSSSNAVKRVDGPQTNSTQMSHSSNSIKLPVQSPDVSRTVLPIQPEKECHYRIVYVNAEEVEVAPPPPPSTSIPHSQSNVQQTQSHQHQSHHKHKSSHNKKSHSSILNIDGQRQTKPSRVRVETIPQINELHSTKQSVIVVPQNKLTMPSTSLLEQQLLKPNNTNNNIRNTNASQQVKHVTSTTACSYVDEYDSNLIKYCEENNLNSSTAAAVAAMTMLSNMPGYPNQSNGDDQQEPQTSNNYELEEDEQFSQIIMSFNNSSNSISSRTTSPTMTSSDYSPPNSYGQQHQQTQQQQHNGYIWTTEG